MSDELRAVMARVEKLERQNRLMKIAGLVLITLGGAAVLLGQAAPNRNVVDAHEVLIRDKEGNVRIRLDAKWDDGPSVVLYDWKGQERANLHVEHSIHGGRPYDEPGLTLFDVREQRRVFLASTSVGPTLALIDSRNKPRSALVANGGLVFFDQTGEQQWHLLARQDAPGLILRDAKQKTIWSAP